MSPRTVIGHKLDFISIATAISLTRWSESTMRRRIAEGAISRSLEPGVNGRAMVDLASILPYVDLKLAPDDIDLVLAADVGRAEAQTDLALLFLVEENAKGAVYWLELAVKQQYAAAMYFLGRCYTDGTGVAKDENTGLIWLLKAAQQGHPIAEAQMRQAREKLGAAR